MDKIKESIAQINHYAQNEIPFLFFADYQLNRISVFPLSAVPSHIKYNINGISNQDIRSAFPVNYIWDVDPIEKDTYQKGFDLVMKEILYGNSFLLNLTYPSKIETDLSLTQIFDHSQARYKLLIEDQFTCFSPESFIKIENGIISSYPMKGTIDASIHNAEEQILNNPKELAEHYTIVDLIRNDLSQVAKKVTVDNFRYIDRIRTNGKELLQVSSKITGELPYDYLSTLGDIIFKLLPAGSICGAPKQKTLEIIEQAEIASRNLYTGVMGIFDGASLDCGVMIRAISVNQNKMWYHSGGGITHMSTLDEEYNELIDKIYVPIIETILIQDGAIQNLPYHQQRLNRSRATLFPTLPEIDLNRYIHTSDYFLKGRVKCRVSYDECIRTVSYQFYEPRKIHSIKKLASDTISYSHKYEDRSELKKLYDQRGEHSEILIVKNDLVTDCFYYNVAFYSDAWYTPEQPLLPGTMRAFLLEEKKIILAKISLEDIPSYSKVCLFNALNPFGEIELDISKIL